MQKKSKILFAAYHDINANGRCQRVLDAAELLGESIFVSYRPPADARNRPETKIVVTGDGKRKYAPFVLSVVHTIRRERPDIVILHDNYCACILPFINKMRPKPFVVYDSSELYIDKKPGGVVETIAWGLQWFENRYIASADFVIAANQERADIMREVFSLRETPYVFENIRAITEEPDEEACDKAFMPYLAGDAFSIVYAGGVSQDRLTYSLIKAVKELGPAYSLLLAGSMRKDEKRLFDEAMGTAAADNVKYLGYLKRSELRYLFRHVKLSVSMFQKNSLNNINCASGKFYESVFEGCPVLTSTNPPLKRICEKYGIGISTDDLTHGILEMQRNYAYFKHNAERFAGSIHPSELVSALADAIKQRFSRSLGTGK